MNEVSTTEAATAVVEEREWKFCPRCDAHLVHVLPQQNRSPIKSPHKKRRNSKTIRQQQQETAINHPNVIHLGRAIGSQITFGRQVGNVDIVLEEPIQPQQQANKKSKSKQQKQQQQQPQHTISRKHATIAQTSQREFTITDNSLNGVFINDIRIQHETPVLIKDNDRITFGGGGTLSTGETHIQPESLFNFIFHLSIITKQQSTTQNEEEEEEEENNKIEKNKLKTFLARTSTGELLLQSKEKEFTREIIEELICPVCQELLIDPITITCGHCFCSLCFESWKETCLTTASTTTPQTESFHQEIESNCCCPVCRVPLESKFHSIVSCVTLTNIISKVVLALPKEEQESYLQRQQESKMIQNEANSVKKLIASIKKAKEHGTRFLRIDEQWNDDERNVFLSGIARYCSGKARFVYCESVGLTMNWIRSATTDLLLIASENLGLSSSSPITLIQFLTQQPIHI